MAAPQYWFEDFTLGRQFSGTSHALDDAAFNQFAQMTGDAHPLHYDAEYAKKTPFGKPVAHGLLLMSMTALGATPLSDNVEASMVAFIEQGGKFLKPVLVGDTEETLSARILRQEHLLYPLVVRWIAEGRVAQQGGRVAVAGVRPGATLLFSPDP